MNETFNLKCVGCGIVEKRPASECREQPFCNKCYMPMTLEQVEITTRKLKEERKS